VIGDFDVSLTLDDRINRITETIIFSGTIDYAAPEIREQKLATFKSDIYSAGILLNEIKPSSVNLDLIDKLLVRCCSSNPYDRPTAPQAFSVVNLVFDQQKEMLFKSIKAYCITDYPSYWKNRDSESFFDRITISIPSNTLLGDSFEVCKIERLENSTIWQLYSTRCKIMKSQLSKMNFLQINVNVLEGSSFDIPSCDSTLNECYLFHTTKIDLVDSICKNGFRKTPKKGNYGSGIYFSQSSSYCTSFQLSSLSTPDHDKLYPLFVSRVLIGRHKRIFHSDRNSKELPSVSPNHSVIGGSSSIEYIVYDESQTYPEYLIWYKIRDLQS